MVGMLFHMSADFRKSGMRRTCSIVADAFRVAEKELAEQYSLFEDPKTSEATGEILGDRGQKTPYCPKTR